MHVRAITLRTIQKTLKERFGFTKFVASGKDLGIRFALKEPSDRHPFWTISSVGMSKVAMELPEGVDPIKFRRAEVMISLPKSWRPPLREDGMLDEDSNKFWPMGLIWGISRLVKRLHVPIYLDAVHPVPALVIPSGRFGAVLFTETQRAKNGTWYVSVKEDTDINFYQMTLLLRREYLTTQRQGLKRIKSYLPENAFIFRPMRQSAVTHPHHVICMPLHRKVQKRKTSRGSVLYVPTIAYLWQWGIENYAVNAHWFQNHYELAKAVKEKRMEVLWEALSDRLQDGLDVADCEPWARAFFVWYFQAVQENEKTNYAEDWLRLKKGYLGCPLERLNDTLVPWREDIRERIWKMIARRIDEFLSEEYSYAKPARLSPHLLDAPKGTYCMVSPTLWMSSGPVGLAYRVPREQRLLGRADSGWRFFVGDEAFRNDSPLSHRFLVVPVANYFVRHGGLLKIRDAEPGSWWIHTYRLHYEKLAQRVKAPRRITSSDFDVWALTDRNQYV